MSSLVKKRVDPSLVVSDEIKQPIDPAICLVKVENGQLYDSAVITVEANDWRERALVDTGAKRTCISQELVVKLGLVVMESKVDLVDVSDNQLSVVGQVKLMIRLNKRQVEMVAMVIVKLPEPIILGEDFLKKFPEGRRILESIRMLDINCELRATKRARVPAGSVKLVRLRKSDLKKDENLVEGMMIAPGVISVSGLLMRAKPYVAVINMSAEPVVLGGMVIASVGTEKESKIDRTGKCANVNVADLIKELIFENLSMEESEKLRELLLEFHDLFTESSFPGNRISKTVHRIITTGHPVKTRPRYQSVQHRLLAKEFVNNLLQANLIEKAQSPWSAPTIFAKKKDGTFRFCIDYRSLNEQTVKDTFPMIRNESLWDQLFGSKYFSTMDLASGYWQIPLEEESKPKTAFVTSEGVYQWLVMPQGLTNAPATFQRFITEMIETAGMEDYAVAKIDDVLVYSGGTFLDHLEKLKRAFETFRQWNCRLKLRKCFFAKNRVMHLGMIINEQGVRPDQSRIEAIRKLGIPKDKAELRSLLGAIGYYRRHIPGFAMKTAEMTQLLRKSAVFMWTDKMSTNLSQLLDHLVNDPIVAYPDAHKGFILRTDASRKGIGCVLLQEQDGEERIIAAYSRTLKDAERNYSATALEALAIVFGVRKCHSYLYGTDSRIETDHAALEYILKTKNQNLMVARWWITLKEVAENLVITHIRGTDNNMADVLSRLFYLSEHPNYFTVDEIKKAQDQDSEVQSWVEAVKTKTMKVFRKNLRLEAMIDKNGVLFVGGRYFIPRNLQIRALELLHEVDETGAHLGVNKSWRRAKKYFFWPKMVHDLRRWIITCKPCQMNKISRLKILKKVGEMPMTWLPWNRIHVDAVGPLICSLKGNKYLLTVVDTATKYAMAIPVLNITTEETIKALEEEVFYRHGYPFILYSDRGSNFVSEEFRMECIRLGIDSQNTVAYNPQANGIVERFNGTLMDLIKPYMDSEMTNWDQVVQKMVFAYNISPHGDLKISPFELLYGRPAMIPLDTVLKGEDMVNFADWVIKRTRLMADKSMTLERHSILVENVRTTEESIDCPFQVGQKVLRKIINMSQEDKSTKLRKRWEGPFEVVDISKPLTPAIRGDDGRVDCVHSRYLKPFADMVDLCGQSKKELEKRRSDLNRTKLGVMNDGTDDGAFVPESVSRTVVSDVVVPAVPVTAEVGRRTSSRQRKLLRREGYIDSDYLALVRM